MSLTVFGKCQAACGGCCCKKLANNSDVKLMSIRTLGGGGFWAAGRRGGFQEVPISINSFGCSAKTFVVCLLVLNLVFVQPLLYTVRSG